MNLANLVNRTVALLQHAVWSTSQAANAAGPTRSLPTVQVEEEHTLTRDRGDGQFFSFLRHFKVGKT